jgi:hypothetical protein
MGRQIVLQCKVYIVGGYEGDIQLPSEVDELRVYLLQLRQGVALQFEVVIAEDLLVPNCGTAGFLEAPVQQQSRDLALEAPGEGHQSLMVLGQKLPIHPGLIVETIEV